MRILIITQKVDVNDPILGFFHRWIEEFASKYKEVSVICLYEGEHNLPDNVRVFSLGKEKGVSKFGYLKNFYRYIFSLKDKYDQVFVHMNPEYVVLGGLFWRIWKKNTMLWYTHKAKNLKLLIALKLSDYITTASKYSFNIKSKKLNIIGHGIDTEQFVYQENMKTDNIFKILYVGRITRIKNIDTLIHAVDHLRDLTRVEFVVEIIGEQVSDDDKIYHDELFEIIREKNLHRFVSFLGSVPHKDVGKRFASADISVNLSPTGGIDKTVLESLLVGTPAFVSNLAFEVYYGKFWNDFSFEQSNARMLAEKISIYINKDKSYKESTAKFLSDHTKGATNIKSLVNKIVKIFSKK